MSDYIVNTVKLKQIMRELFFFMIVQVLYKIICLNVPQIDSKENIYEHFSNMHEF